jgi:hypothetical protein
MFVEPESLILTAVVSRWNVLTLVAEMYSETFGEASSHVGRSSGALFQACFVEPEFPFCTAHVAHQNDLPAAAERCVETWC